MEKEEIIIDEKVGKSFRNNIVLSCIWLILSTACVVHVIDNLPEGLGNMLNNLLAFLIFLWFAVMSCVNIILGCISILLSKKNEKDAYIVNIFAIVFYLISVVALLPLICSIYVLPLLILGIILGVFYVKSNVKYAKYFKKKKISNL